jgi:arginyl-tRNA synthetase
VTIREELEKVLRGVLEQEFPTLKDLKFEVYQPRDKSFGDFATNLAILVGKAAGANPMAVAGRIAERCRAAAAAAVISAVDVAKPGFVNISVAHDLYLEKLRAVLAAKDPAGYGASSLGAGKMIQVEFVSANPTGPLNVVSARAAAVGDALVRLLNRVGYDARSEFYVNDAGTQFELLGKSLEARFRQILGERAEIPEGGYPGEYLVPLAERIKGLAEWADARRKRNGGLAEPDGAREAELITRFVKSGAGPDASPDATTGTEAAASLLEYRDFRQALATCEQAVWPALYICMLSGRGLVEAAFALRLRWIDAYRDWLVGVRVAEAAAKAGSGSVRTGAGAPEAGPEGPVAAASVFLGEAVAQRKFDFGRFAVETIIEGQRRSLEKFGARPEGGPRFDAWVRESTLRDLVGKVFDALLADGRFVFEKDGAVWLGSAQGDGQADGQAEPDGEAGADAGGEKDEWVIRRRTGQPTYFLSDIAYHVDKRRRGFDRVIDIWGPDHHGHIERMKRAMAMVSEVMPDLAIGAGWLEILIAQQVNLMREGKRVQMSKRAGEYITLDDVVDEVGPDAARLFFLMRRCNSHLDFDLDLAKKTSEENPVYYIQYAHARISSVLEFARGSGFADVPGGADLSLLKAVEEIDLLKALADFDEVVKASALSLEPHRIVTYLVELAAKFHRFYHNHRVVTEDKALTEARLCLSYAARTILRSGLALVGVSAPTSM